MPRKLTDDMPDVAVRFGHVLQVLCDWVDTTIMVMVCGRGTAKSTVIIARRSYRCVLLMPGAPLAIVGNTYANLKDNILPAVQKGWQLMGWQPGIHYVYGVKPPESWQRRCSVIVDDYRHVISFFNGSVLFLGSLDNPSLLAGKSVVHLFFDEAKYAKEVRANRALPILRGDAISYGSCHLFLGLTITTDMPDVTENEDDWYFPTRGSRFKAEYAYLTDNFAQLDDKAGMSEVNANWRSSFSIGSRFTLQPMVYGRLLFGSTIPPVFGNTIGGDWFGHYVEQQMPFAGIGNMEYVDHQFVAAQLQAQQRIGSNSYVLLRVAGAQQSDHLKDILDYRTILGGQIAYYYNTIVGPVGATLGYSNRTKKPYFFLNLGYEF